MSVENNLERIANALEALVKLKSGEDAELLSRYAPRNQTPTQQPVTNAVLGQAIPAIQAPVNQPFGNQVISSAFSNLQAQAAVSANPTLPFTDGPSMVEWAKGIYINSSSDKQAKFNSLIQDMGVSNITAIPTNKYVEFYQRVMGL